MADLSQMIRWNANFVRGLAESVLNRAKRIRSSLAVDAAAPSTSGSGERSGTMATSSIAALSNSSGDRRRPRRKSSVRRSKASAQAPSPRAGKARAKGPKARK